MRRGWQAPHDRAMALCDEADVAWRREFFGEASALFASALSFEHRALRLFDGPAWWRRVLRRSLKSIAWCKRLTDRGVTRREARKAEGR